MNSRKPHDHAVSHATCRPGVRCPDSSHANRLHIKIHITLPPRTTGSVQVGAASCLPNTDSPIPEATPNVSSGTDTRIDQRLKRSNRSRLGNVRPVVNI